MNKKFKIKILWKIEHVLLDISYYLDIIKTKVKLKRWEIENKE